MLPRAPHPAPRRRTASGALLNLLLATATCVTATCVTATAAEDAESHSIDLGPVALAPETSGGNIPVLTPTPIPATDEHAADVLTDLGLAGSAAVILTPAERLKLEAARAAIDASRAAGTFLAPLVGAVDSPASPRTREEIEAHKLRRLEELNRADVQPSEIAGIGIEHPAIQEIGPSGLNAIEEAKLRGEPLPALPASPVVPSMPQESSHE